MSGEEVFSGDNELIERYRFETSTKVINNPKVVSFDWLKSQKLDNVTKLLKDQSLRRFLEMKGNIYPDLIRVFYTNLKFEGNNLVSHVKGVDMEITYDVWTVVAGLKCAGLRINKGNLGVVEDKLDNGYLETREQIISDQIILHKILSLYF